MSLDFFSLYIIFNACDIIFNVRRNLSNKSLYLVKQNSISKVLSTGMCDFGHNFPAFGGVEKTGITILTQCLS